jgi:spore germination protein KB
MFRYISRKLNAASLKNKNESENKTMDKTEKAVKNTLYGLIIGGLTLLLASVRNTVVLGNTQTIWTSPSFQSTRLIDIGTVLARMDFLVGIAQTMLTFMKCSLFFYALATAFSQLFGLNSYQPLILPLAGIEVIVAATVYQSPVDHAAYPCSKPYEGFGLPHC